MLKIHMFRKPQNNWGLPWAEFHTDLGFGEAWPIHPAEVEERILGFLLDGRKEFACSSWLGVQVVARLRKDGLIRGPVTLEYWPGSGEGNTVVLQMDTEGLFVEPWPELDKDVPYDSDVFIYLYSEHPPRPSVRQWYADELAKREKITKLADFVGNLMEEKN